MSKIIVNAMNVHQGGGGVLLTAFLQQLPDVPVVLLHDQRFSPPEEMANLTAIPVPGRLKARIEMEKKLASMAESGDKLLCFGSQPPLFKSKATVTLFLQNALLVNDFPLKDYSLRARVRNTLAKWLLQGFSKNVDRIWVQTPTMAKWTANKLPKKDILVKPFLPLIETKTSNQFKRYDFIYIAHLEPHKNHRRLIEAWVELAKQNIRPSLLLNLTTESDQPFMQWIQKNKQQHDLILELIQPITRDEIFKYYQQSHMLIYPSLCESLGLPLIEAETLGLPIIASELDFIHDVVSPEATFDPYSVDSIVEAVKHASSLKIKQKTPVFEPVPVPDLWQDLLES